jgi:hypothetical protein
MPWLSRVEVARHFKAKDFAVDLSPDPGTEFKHLVLTGPNGSGKTTILAGMEWSLRHWMVGGRQANHQPFTVTLHWTADGVPAAWKNNDFVAIYSSMQRHMEVSPTKGPTRMRLVNASPETIVAHLRPKLRLDDRCRRMASFDRCSADRGPLPARWEARVGGEVGPGAVRDDLATSVH